MMRITYLISALLLTVIAIPVNADLIINALESGNDVAFTVNGTLDLSGATEVASGGRDFGINNTGDNWWVSTGLSTSVRWYNLSTSDGNFGTGGHVLANSYSGDAFAIWGGNGSGPKVFVPSGFSSGSSITSGMVFNNETFASLSMTPGTYNYSVPNDTITMNIGANAIPEPSAFLFLGSVASVGMAYRWRQILRRAFFKRALFQY